MLLFIFSFITLVVLRNRAHFIISVQSKYEHQDVKGTQSFPYLKLEKESRFGSTLRAIKLITSKLKNENALSLIKEHSNIFIYFINFDVSVDLYIMSNCSYLRNMPLKAQHRNSLEKSMRRMKFTLRQKFFLRIDISLRRKLATFILKMTSKKMEDHFRNRY